MLHVAFCLICEDMKGDEICDEMKAPTKRLAPFGDSDVAENENLFNKNLRTFR